MFESRYNTSIIYLFVGATISLMRFKVIFKAIPFCFLLGCNNENNNVPPSKVEVNSNDKVTSELPPKPKEVVFINGKNPYDTISDLIDCPEVYIKTYTLNAIELTI